MKKQQPGFLHYLIAILTTIGIAMFLYPLYIDNLYGLAIALPVAFGAGFLLFRWITRHIRSRNKNILRNVPEELMNSLEEHIEYYRQLDADARKEFAKQVDIFLQEKTITGIDTDISELDRLYVATSAIIPIFAFHDWEYQNLDEIFLYPGSFNQSYETAGDGRNISGMVGNRHLNDKMILSLPDLRRGFELSRSRHNVGIHEFIHLIDDTDGAIDGVPEPLLEHQYVTPWLKLIRQEMKKITKNHSDLGTYAATNEAEFLAVAGEYFFQQPDRLQSKHPELYRMLCRIFRQNPLKVILRRK